MKNERILSHKMSKVLTMDEIKDVSSGGTCQGTTKWQYSHQGGWVIIFDVDND